MRNKYTEETPERLIKNRVRATIETYCDEHLEDAEDVLIFEALPDAIHYVISVVEEEELTSRYEISQVEETKFSIKLRTLSL